MSGVRGRGMSSISLEAEPSHAEIAGEQLGDSVTPDLFAALALLPTKDAQTQLLISFMVTMNAAAAAVIGNELTAELCDSCALALRSSTEALIGATPEEMRASLAENDK